MTVARKLLVPAVNDFLEIFVTLSNAVYTLALWRRGSPRRALARRANERACFDARTVFPGENPDEFENYRTDNEHIWACTGYHVIYDKIPISSV